MRISAAQRKNRIRAAMDRLLRGEIMRLRLDIQVAASVRRCQHQPPRAISVLPASRPCRQGTRTADASARRSAARHLAASACRIRRDSAKAP
jgi:hypothetical protein